MKGQKLVVVVLTPRRGTRFTGFAAPSPAPSASAEFEGPALAQTSSLSSGVKTILSASVVGLCQWNIDSEER